MNYERVIYEMSKGVARITLNCPDKLNALSADLFRDFDDALREAGEDADVRVIVIKGAGKSFCAGADLSEARSLTYVTEQREREKGNLARWDYLWNLPKISIAQIHGHWLAGGIMLVSGCDLFVAAEDARIGFPLSKAGAIAGGMWPWHIGLLKTKELCLTGDLISGKEAERLGLVNRAVPADKLEEEVDKLAAKIAEIPADILGLHKESINRAFEIMGVRAALASAQDLHIIGHGARSALEFAQRMRDEGFTGTLNLKGLEKPGLG